MKDLQQCLREKIQELFGDMGSGEIGQVTVVKFFESELTKLFIVRTLRELEHQVHFSLSCLTKLKEEDVVIRTVLTKSSERNTVDAMKGLMKTYIDHIYQNSDADNHDRQKALESMEKTMNLIDL